MKEGFFTKKKTLKIILLICIFIFILLITYGTYLFINLKNTMNDIYDDSIKLETTSKIESPSEKDTHYPPLSILLLGIDSWKSTGRSDTIIVLTLNPEKKSMTQLSIPRDTYTEIIGLNTQDKINHSYAFGGVRMTVQTVENLLQIPIHYVVAIDMEGFAELVDILGGVKVKNEYSFSTDDFYFEKGNLTLSGKQALEYVRMRKEDPEGDFGRQKRQRQVLESLMKDISSANVLWQAPSILKSIRKHVETNIAFNEMIEFASNYKDTLQNIEQLSFHEGQGVLKNNIWYYELNNDELTSIQNQLKNSLNMNN